LTKSYPWTTFLVTAGSGQPLAPGQNPDIARILPVPGSNGQSFGDPRTQSQGFYQINSGFNALIGGTSPGVKVSNYGGATNIGGSDLQTSNSDNWLFWIALGGIIYAVFFMR
jgi:hypothetical protein